MRHRLLRSALISLLAASSLATVAPVAAHAAPGTPGPTTAAAAAASAASAISAVAAGGDACDGTYDGRQTVLSIGQKLTPGQKMTSPTNSTELVMQPDGNLVTYALGNPGGPRLPLWSTGTWGNPGAYATMQEDGNFVVYREGGGPGTGGALWHSDSYGTKTDRTPKAYLTADGALEVLGRKNYSWQSDFWNGTRERSTRICAVDDVNRYRYRFRGDWFQTASVWMILQRDNNVVIYRKSDGKAIWSSGTYNVPYPIIELVMQGDGNLLLRNWMHPEQITWAAGTYNNPGAYALLQDDGNFVVYKADGGPGKGGALWSTYTWDKI